jgi:hypothetical protein
MIDDVCAKVHIGTALIAAGGHSSRFSLRGPNMDLYDIGIEHALSMPIERPQSRDARELDRAATFGRARYQLRCCEDDRRAAFG